MKDRKLIGQPLTTLAASVLLALGSSAIAQQPGADQPGAQQPGQEQPGAQQPGAQQPGAEQPGAEQPGAQQPGAQPGQQPGAQPGQQPGELPERDWEDDDDLFTDEQDQFEDEDDRDVALAEPRGEAIDLDRISQEHENLSRFVEAVRIAGMEDALAERDYTVFAPTDEAFEQLELEIERENWEEVANLLRAHIVADDVDREMAGRIGQAMTLDGGQVELTEREGELMVADARVVEEDFQIGNLRVYVIDGLITEQPRDIDVAVGDDPQFERDEPAFEDDDDFDFERDEPDLERDDDPFGERDDDPFGEPRDEPGDQQRDDPFGAQQDDDDFR